MLPFDCCLPILLKLMPQQDTTRMFLCCLHNISADKKHFDGMMPTDIYNQLGLEAVIRKDERVEWLVSNCLQRGYIEPVGDTGRINMTACGHQLCLSGEEDQDLRGYYLEALHHML